MEPKEYLEKFLATRSNPVTDQNRKSFDRFCTQQQYLDAVTQILSLQHMLQKEWQIKTRVDEIIDQHVLIPNGSVNKPYNAVLDFEQLKWMDISDYQMDGLTETGLQYNSDDKTITGTPAISGDLRIIMRFRINLEDNKETWNEKQIPLIINPDPKSLWKNIASDKEAAFWKEDHVAVCAPLGNHHIVVASKRGRSHANVGSFRDDDFAFKHFITTGWSVIALSDGAGSARYSREGSRIACENVIDYFSDKKVHDRLEGLDALMEHFHQDADPDIKKEIDQFARHEMHGAAKHVLEGLEQKALESEASLSDFHATLIFVLIRKFSFGHAILSFGVGDCPIAVLHNDVSSVTVMNTLDVGEFGGGTRFITMPEIFQQDKFAGRCSFAIIEHLDYLVMMSDGIYDPKFEVEANLSRMEKWKAFLADLNGENPDGKKVRLDPANPDVATELSDWMDFWSPGNHDDRTLAIVF